MKRLILVLLIVFCLLSPLPARADIAPPAQPPGASLEPGRELTQVRMLAEIVLLEIQPGNSLENLGHARVTADFTMLNLGPEAEKMAVRFPISASDGFSGYPELKNLQVQVNGRAASTRRIQGEDPTYGGGSVPWAEFDVTFPPGVEVPVRVSYRLDGTGEYPFVSFRYLLTTGAAWQGTIGRADLIVRLPYEANVFNVILDEQIGWSQTTAGATLINNEVRWSYTDLEPEYEHNLDVALVMPAVWQKVLAEQENVTRNPQDGEAWGRLGKLYKEIAFLRRTLRGDSGGPVLYQLGVQAYENCLALRPNDALWHTGFAELFYKHYFVTPFGNPDDKSDLVHALDHLHAALEINPRTALALEMLEMISYDAPEYVRQEGEGYVFLYLTATPVPPSATPPPPTVTPEATSTVAPTATTAPASQTLPPRATATEVALAAPSLPPKATAGLPVEEKPASTSPSVCGALILAPLAAGLWLSHRQIRNGGRLRVE